VRFHDHFSGHAADYARARPTYPDALFAWLAAEAPGRALAWDCATGNGQAAVALAAYFEEVFATDASGSQVANAVPHPRVRYAVAPADVVPLADGTVDLVTVAQAAHWFDLPRFFAEAVRVLRPGGLLALWGYGLMRVAPGVDPLIDRFDREIVGPWWPPERRLIDERYASIALPLPDVAPPPFEMHVDWDLEGLLAYVGTWSSVHRHRADRGEDPMLWLRSALAAVWGEPSTVRRVTWPLFLEVGRRP
jgi:SAM-dependent methyltransferase